MILITGGSGYIGSHALAELLKIGEDVVVLDNFTNSSEIAIENVSKISNKNFNFILGDIGDEKLLNQIFSEFEINTVFHFAGLKSITESIRSPLQCYLTNVS